MKVTHLPAIDYNKSGYTKAYQALIAEISALPVANVCKVTTMDDLLTDITTITGNSTNSKRAPYIAYMAIKKSQFEKYSEVEGLCKKADKKYQPVESGKRMQQLLINPAALARARIRPEPKNGSEADKEAWKKEFQTEKRKHMADNEGIKLVHLLAGLPAGTMFQVQTPGKTIVSGDPAYKAAEQQLITYRDDTHRLRKAFIQALQDECLGAVPLSVLERLLPLFKDLKITCDITLKRDGGIDAVTKHVTANVIDRQHFIHIYNAMVNLGMECGLGVFSSESSATPLFNNADVLSGTVYAIENRIKDLKIAYAKNEFREKLYMQHLQRKDVNQLKTLSSIFVYLNQRPYLISYEVDEVIDNNLKNAGIDLHEIQACDFATIFNDGKQWAEQMSFSAVGISSTEFFKIAIDLVTHGLEENADVAPQDLSSLLPPVSSVTPTAHTTPTVASTPSLIAKDDSKINDNNISLSSHPTARGHLSSSSSVGVTSSVSKIFIVDLSRYSQVPESLTSLAIVYSLMLSLHQFDAAAFFSNDGLSLLQASSPFLKAVENMSLSSTICSSVEEAAELLPKYFQGITLSRGSLNTIKTYSSDDTLKNLESFVDNLDVASDEKNKPNLLYFTSGTKYTFVFRVGVQYICLGLFDFPKSSEKNLQRNVSLYDDKTQLVQFLRSIANDSKILMRPFALLGESANPERRLSDSSSSSIPTPVHLSSGSYSPRPPSVTKEYQFQLHTYDLSTKSVKTLTLPLHIGATMTVSDIKPKIKELSGIEPEYQHLIISGVSVRDEDLLLTLKLHAFTRVHLIDKSPTSSSSSALKKTNGDLYRSKDTSYDEQKVIIADVIQQRQSPDSAPATQVEQGADVNAQNELGQTPLHLAVQQRNCETIAQLIKQGARLDVKDNQDEEPLARLEPQDRIEVACRIAEVVEASSESLSLKIKTKPLSLAFANFLSANKCKPKLTFPKNYNEYMTFSINPTELEKMTDAKLRDILKQTIGSQHTVSVSSNAASSSSGSISNGTLSLVPWSTKSESIKRDLELVVQYDLEYVFHLPEPAGEKKYGFPSAKAWAQEFLPGVYIGEFAAVLSQYGNYSLMHSDNHESLSELSEQTRYDVIFDVSGQPTLGIALHDDHYQQPIDDIGTADNFTVLKNYFEQTVLPKLNAARLEGKKVLINCREGQSRSATVAIMLLMKQYGLTAVEAYHYLKAHRPRVSPNTGFFKQLLAYEKELGCVLREETKQLSANWLKEYKQNNFAQFYLYQDRWSEAGSYEVKVPTKVLAIDEDYVKLKIAAQVFIDFITFLTLEGHEYKIENADKFNAEVAIRHELLLTLAGAPSIAAWLSEEAKDSGFDRTEMLDQRSAASAASSSGPSTEASSLKPQDTELDDIAIWNKLFKMLEESTLSDSDWEEIKSLLSQVSNKDYLSLPALKNHQRRTLLHYLVTHRHRAAPDVVE